MTELLTSLVGPAMEDLGKTILARVKRQVIYLCCFNSNIQSLREEAQNLEAKRAGLQMQVDEAENNAQVILPGVETWLANAATKINITEIENEIPKARRGFLNMKARYSTSRKAKKTTEAMKELVKSCNFNPISQPAQPASMVSLPLGSTHEVPSRKEMEDDIMQALRGNKVNTLGICGMGGVGKTTMAERIMNRVREEHLFEEAMKVVVSQQVDLFRIQQEIGGLLGIKKWEMETLSGRAHQLRVRLTGGKKRILLVLDDVWESLKLEDLGIPRQNEGCKILLTSRNMDALNEMDTQKICAVEILSEIEAWHLFREKVGTFVDDLGLLSTAKQLVEECNGLPLALTTVGTTLKNKKSKRIWEDALQQLRSSNPIDMPLVLEKVYKPVKLSYDFLVNPHARAIFLLCCLFPEDHDIDIEYLTLYGMGLRMFEGIEDLEQARNRVCTLLDTLKSSFLLLDGCEENHVKMHDVVRDVAVFIASKEGRIHQNFSSIDYSREESINCEWISVVGEEINKLPTWLSFPSLGLILIDNCSTELQIRINPCFFQRMEELNVLYFGGIPFRSLPETTQLLKKLRTLYLEYCFSLTTIAIVGELLSLEILICRSCDELVELPVEIGRLSRLKLLEVSRCGSLKRIAPGVISKLVRLEELMIINSFAGWETKANGAQRDNAALCELEHLKNLTRLEIEIEDPSKTVKSMIRLGGRGWLYEKKRMHLELEEKEITLGKWIHVFLTSAEYLFARGDGANNLGLAQSRSLKKLIYEDCSTVKNLVNITSSMDWGIGVFPLLESLRLRELPNLEEICDAPIPKASNSFGNLKKLKLEELPALRHLWKSPHQNVSLCNLSSIELHGCDKLCGLFPLEIANSLIQLEKLRIEKCAMLEEVLFPNEENENDEDRCHITFPKLKNLDLLYLPRLTTFCKGSESIKFPKLHFVVIRGCSKLANLISCTWDSLHFEGRDGDSFLESCNQKVIFGSLKQLVVAGYDNINNIWFYQISHIMLGSQQEIHIAECDNISFTWCYQISRDSFRQIEKLYIDRCNGIKSLFSFSIAENLVNLKELTIERCIEMVTVIEDDKMSSEKRHIKFPNLQVLRLRSLSNLRSLCRCDLQLPLMEKLFIRGYPLEEFFTTTFVSSALPLLQQLSILECPLLEFLTTETIILGSLQEIHIAECDNISSTWCYQISHDSFSKLVRLFIDRCNRIKSLFSFSIAENLVNLKELTIKRCMEMVTVIEDDKMSSEKHHIQFPNLQVLGLSYLFSLRSFFPCRCDLKLPLLEQLSIVECPLLEFLTTGTILLGSLQEIYIAECDNISSTWCYQISHDSFSQLEKLYIDRCDGIKSLFSFSISENLVNLKELTIERCMEMVTVIEDDKMPSEMRHIQFPNLQVLGLRYLSNLRSFFLCRCDLQLPLLEKLFIRGCPLEEFFSIGTIMLGSLQEIHIAECDNISWCYQISHDSFSQLEKVYIDRCNDIKSLFSFSIAENLVNLKELTIERCMEMVTVIEDDKMSSENRHIQFPNLQVLRLRYLFSLRSFFPRRCDLKLPLLDQLSILECPLLEFLTTGTESTLAEAKEMEKDHKKCKTEEEKIEEVNEEQTSSDGTNGGWDQKKEPGHDEINRISERDRVVDTLQLFPLNPLNTEADHSEKLRFSRDDYKKTNTTFTYNGDEEIDHPTLDLQLKL